MQQLCISNLTCKILARHTGVSLAQTIWAFEPLCCKAVLLKLIGGNYCNSEALPSQWLNTKFTFHSHHSLMWVPHLSFTWYRFPSWFPSGKHAPPPPPTAPKVAAAGREKDDEGMLGIMVISILSLLAQNVAWPNQTAIGAGKWEEHTEP